MTPLDEADFDAAAARYDAEMASKFEKNASTLYAADRIERMRDIIFDIENRNVRQLTALLGKPDRS